MRRPALVGALALVSMLSACSLNADKSGTAPSTPSGVRSGGVLRVGITAPGGIDPLDAYEPVGMLISSAKCDTLVSLDPVTGQVREALAKGWVLTNGAGMTIKLRHGVKFSNGTELRARDVNYSLQQLVATSNGNYAAGLAKPFAVLAVGKKSTSILADPDKAADIAVGLSRYDFQLVNSPLDGGELRALAEPAMAPLSEAALAADPTAAAGNPTCVGPYVLTKPYHGGDTRIVLKRSKVYYGKNVGYTGGGKGYADSIVFSVFPTPAAALAAYDKGQVDVVQVPRDDVAKTKDIASRVFGPATGVEYVGLPGTSTGPFSDPDVRTALSLAVDRKALVAGVFGPADQVATGFEPPALAIREGTSLDDKTLKGAPLTSCGDTTPGTPDLAAATQLLAKAAAKPGAKPLTGFTLEVNDDSVYPAMARALAAQWKAGLGLTVNVVTTPWSTYAAKGAGSPGFDTPFRIRWSTHAISPYASFNDEQQFLGPIASEAGSTVANWSHFSDRDVEFALAQTAATATSVPARGAEFAKIGKALCKQMPMIPLVFDRPAFLVRSSAILAAREVPVGRDGVLLLRELSLR